MKNAHFTTIFRQEPEGGFTVTVPALPGCISYGRTLDEARHMITDAIIGYVVSLEKHGEVIPTDDQSMVATIDLPLPPEYVAQSA